MATEQELDAVRKALTEKGISLSSPRAHAVFRSLSPDFSNAEELLNAAEVYEARARNSWLVDALDPWCARHGITRRQALSILFDDNSFNKENPKKDLITKDVVFSWGGQQNDFYTYFSANPDELDNSKEESSFEAPRG